jgi:hypothetical protein
MVCKEFVWKPKAEVQPHTAPGFNGCSQPEQKGKRQAERGSTAKATYAEAVKQGPTKSKAQDKLGKQQGQMLLDLLINSQRIHEELNSDVEQMDTQLQEQHEQKHIEKCKVQRRGSSKGSRFYGWYLLQSCKEEEFNDECKKHRHQSNLRRHTSGHESHGSISMETRLSGKSRGLRDATA